MRGWTKGKGCQEVPEGGRPFSFSSGQAGPAGPPAGGGAPTPPPAGPEKGRRVGVVGCKAPHRSLSSGFPGELVPPPPLALPLPQAPVGALSPAAVWAGGPTPAQALLQPHPFPEARGRLAPIWSACEHTRDAGIPCPVAGGGPPGPASPAETQGQLSSAPRGAGWARGVAQGLDGGGCSGRGPAVHPPPPAPVDGGLPWAVFRPLPQPL